MRLYVIRAVLRFPYTFKGKSLGPKVKQTELYSSSPQRCSPCCVLRRLIQWGWNMRIWAVLTKPNQRKPVRFSLMRVALFSPSPSVMSQQKFRMKITGSTRQCLMNQKTQFSSQEGVQAQHWRAARISVVHVPLPYANHGKTSTRENTFLFENIIVRKLN